MSKNKQTKTHQAKLDSLIKTYGNIRKENIRYKEGEVQTKPIVKETFDKCYNEWKNFVEKWNNNPKMKEVLSFTKFKDEITGMRNAEHYYVWEGHLLWVLKNQYGITDSTKENRDQLYKDGLNTFDAAVEISTNNKSYFVKIFLLILKKIKKLNL